MIVIKKPVAEHPEGRLVFYVERRMSFVFRESVECFQVLGRNFQSRQRLGSSRRIRQLVADDDEPVARLQWVAFRLDGSLDALHHVQSGVLLLALPASLILHEVLARDVEHAPVAAGIGVVRLVVDSVG